MTYKSVSLQDKPVSSWFAAFVRKFLAVDGKQTPIIPASLALLALAAAAPAQQQGFPPDPPPEPGSLKTVQVPEPLNLSQYVVDRNAAIVLGKALFWEQQAGSDGLACASCHFHAGADNRTTNQLNPGLRNQLGGTVSQTFNKTASNRLHKGGVPPNGGPNYTLKRADFPFRQLANPLDRNSAVVFDTDDVASSQGAFRSQFTATVPLIFLDQCSSSKQVGIFSVGHIGVRQVEPRNTPTVINAVFNYRNFWDGRANDIFNGRNPFGPRDSTASILAADAAGALSPEYVSIANSSLASQAVGPALSDLEMSCSGRVFENLGHKLLGMTPLQLQSVDPTDSVLAPYAGRFLGLTTTYRDLIMKAFNQKYWSSRAMWNGYTQMENNFSLFWGLSIQMYEATLVSDNSPFDQYKDGNRTAMSPEALYGLTRVFMGKGGCSFCHKGAEFTGAATSQLITNNSQGSLVEHMLMGDGNAALYDSGFYNIGVRPPGDDIGLGGADPFGNSLSFTRAAKGMAPPDVSTNHFFFVPLDQFYVNACNFQVLPCQGISRTFRDAVDGSFKTPTLRNVELTGPYFHNGSRSTLEQVIEFYNRGGDRRGAPGADTSGYGPNAANLAPAIQPLGLQPQDIANLVAFLKSLTDERVRWEKAPFDHPSLIIPNGEVGDQNRVWKQDFNGQAMDNLLPLPAVGKDGRAVKGLGPITSFDAGLQ
ncbi:MAG: hypothetical protein QOJ99_2593 [Bryobacterales bacterium]|nr:hypothetical protein [Bryobacterales bacterium]